jgi:predicted secreted Zn-dependent protease
MFRKSLTALAAVAALSAPLASSAQQMPAPQVQPIAVAPQGPGAAPGRPQGMGGEVLVALAAIAVLGAVFAHGH